MGTEEFPAKNYPIADQGKITFGKAV